MRSATLLCVVAAVAWCLPAPGRGEEPAPPASSKSASATASSTSQDPTAELAALDPRRPLPLQPMMAWHQKQNMMEHLVAIQRITDALARDDWDEVARAAARIGSSPQMQMMCRHMGAGAAGFTDMALDFHRRADAIGEAARARDEAAVLRATAKTLQACTGCHAVFRQEVVDAATWGARTGQAHDVMGVD
jgi:cytochrome c556